MTGMAKLGWFGARIRGSGKFQARWCDADGLQSESGFITKEQARTYAQRKSTEALDVKVGTALLRKPIQAARDAFLNRATKGNTRALNERRVDEFLEDMPTIKYTSDLTSHAINQYARNLEAGHNPGGQNHHLKIVRCFTKFCITSKWLTENPFLNFKMPKTEKVGRPLTDDEYDLMVTPGNTHNQYKEGDKWLNLAFRFGHSTMLRISQVWKLTPADFKEPNLIRIDGIKGQDAVWLPLRDEAVAILREMPIRAQQERYFSYWGTVDAMRNSVQDKARRCGIKPMIRFVAGKMREVYPRFHDVCKVTRVTNLGQDGVSLGDVAHLSNTSKRTLAENYMLPDRDRAFANYMGHIRATNGPRNDANVARTGLQEPMVATQANYQNDASSPQISAV